MAKLEVPNEATSVVVNYLIIQISLWIFALNHLSKLKKYINVEFKNLS